MLIVLTTASSSCVPTKTPVDKFKQVLDKAVDMTEIPQGPSYVRLGDGSQGWAKQRYLVSDLAYDVTKTDSLVTPLQGRARFLLTQTRTDLFDEKGLAEQTQDYNGFTQVKSVELSYGYQDGSWLLKSGSYKSLLFGKTPNTLGASMIQDKNFTFTSKKVTAESDASPYSALRYWLGGESQD